MTRSRRVLVGLELVAVGLLGALLGLLVGGTERTQVGPFSTDLTLRPSLSGSTQVAVPPLGRLELDTHDSPVRLDVRIAQLDPEAARRVVADPSSLRGLGAEVDADVREGLRRLVVRTVVVTVAGAALLGLLVFRRWRPTAVAAGSGVVALAAAAGVTALTLDERALSEPRYTGLLASAPTAVGDVRDIVARFDAYNLQLGRLVANVSELYAVTSRLPVFSPTDTTVRVLHISDLHLSPSAYDLVTTVVEQYGIDVVVDTGDSTDFGSDPESRYVEPIGDLDVPYVWIRGNHDSARTQAAVEAQGAVVLDGPEVVEVGGLRFLGQGDPRFTPDKTTRDDDAPTEVLTAVGAGLRDAVRALDVAPPDVVLVHDPITAEPLYGHVPLVLSGHTHERRTVVERGTTHVVQGSTGGAGLRALEGEEPTPVTLTVLYLDPVDGTLQAYDDIVLGGLGATDASIRRSVAVPPVLEPAESPSPSPSASASSSPPP